MGPTVDALVEEEDNFQQQIEEEAARDELQLTDK
jgi:hypothetical protein